VVTDSSGKSAGVYVKVLNAPKGLTYSSTVLPGEGNVDTQSQVSAEQWLTVPKADSIKCTATSSYGTTQSAIVGLEEYKGTLKGDYVTLTGYYGKALTTDTSVLASQTAASGAANSIKIYGSATDDSGTYNVDTSLMGISGGKAALAGLSETSSSGTYTQIEQNGHLHGTFTSTAAYTPTTGAATTTTRTSNYGTEYDLNMKAAQGLLPTGYLGYYVKRGTTAGKIQDAVNAAQSGDTINVAAGKYAENVNINKILTLKGAGNPTATSFALNAILGTGSSGITAPIIYVNPTAKIQDGVTLASLKGTVNVAAGTYVENVNIDKSLTVKGAGATQTIVDGNKAGSVFTIGKNNAKAVVTLSGIAIRNGKADHGGGIYNAGKVTITGSTISANTAEWDGGGIYNEGIMDMTGSTISGNTGRDGGGIYNGGFIIPATLKVTDSTISGNTAESFGGGIYNAGTATITGSTISENTGSNGGGICNWGFIIPATLKVTDSTISGNTAESFFGGGICNGGIENPGILSVTGSSISGNTGRYGGGIYNACTATITGSTISENTGWDGGGISNAGTATITGSTISENTGWDGGGIYNEGTATITDSTISGNTAKWNGGGIYNGGVVTSGTLSVKGSTISGNTAKWNGGGIYSGGFGILATLSVTGSTISGNMAERDGGGIYNDGKLFIGGTSQIINNQATTGYGGAIYSTTNLVSLDGTKVAVKFNKAYSPDVLPVETPWYQGWGVYLTTGIPTTKKGFNPAKQVTGNTRV
jgi:predicted outer membrane repeat protein